MPSLGILPDCPLKGTESAFTCKKTYKKFWWITKWSHLCTKWFLDQDWDTMRFSSLSSPQTNDVQVVLSYESLDLQANVSSLRFSFTKQIFTWRCERRMHHAWDTHSRFCCWSLALLQNLILKATGPVHDKPTPHPPHKLRLVMGFIPNLTENVKTSSPPLLTC